MPIEIRLNTTQQLLMTDFEILNFSEASSSNINADMSQYDRVKL